MQTDKIIEEKGRPYEIRMDFLSKMKDLQEKHLAEFNSRDHSGLTPDQVEAERQKLEQKIDDDIRIVFTEKVANLRALGYPLSSQEQKLNDYYLAHPQQQKEQPQFEHDYFQQNAENHEKEEQREQEQKQPEQQEQKEQQTDKEQQQTDKEAEQKEKREAKLEAEERAAILVELQNIYEVGRSTAAHLYDVHGVKSAEELLEFAKRDDFLELIKDFPRANGAPIGERVERMLQGAAEKVADDLQRSMDELDARKQEIFKEVDTRGRELEDFKEQQKQVSGPER